MSLRMYPLQQHVCMVVLCQYNVFVRRRVIIITLHWPNEYSVPLEGICHLIVVLQSRSSELTCPTGLYKRNNVLLSALLSSDYSTCM